MFQLKSPALTILLSIFVLTLGALIVMAGPINDDLRINQVHHFGGDALYCVDSLLEPTSDFDTMMRGGGFRLLDKAGQELWFVSSRVVKQALTESLNTGWYEPFETGVGTYGQTFMTVLGWPNGTASFTFAGYDEYLKMNDMAWDGCMYIGVPNFGDDPEPLVEEVEEQQQGDGTLDETS